MSKVRVIAFYLPQYHPTIDNDKWWGKGFTEWTNVGKARPLFPGHYQPRIPADLGYYDLRLPEVREQQAKLAREAGIEGFCYYHYWFGNGKRELERPFDEVLTSGKPDFPFMLCWANESWHSKFWNKDGSVSKKLLVEQTYPGDEDIVSHFQFVLQAFKDKRYITIDEKPVFMIYQPDHYEEVSHFMDVWRDLAVRNGLPGIFFIASLLHDGSDERVNALKEMGFDAVNTVRLWDAFKKKVGGYKYIIMKIVRMLFGIPYLVRYKKIVADMLTKVERRKDVFPTIVPNWDHSPRSGRSAMVLTGATPDVFSRHIDDVLSIVNEKPIERRLIFLKSWNEWGEGNYVEPDLRYGKQYIEVMQTKFGN